MQQEFIKRATSFSKFNFRESDFTSTSYKDEIRHLFNLYYFPDLELKDIAVSSVNISAINSSIKKLKSANAPKFNEIYAYELGYLGPGEILLFFILDNAKLGGGSSAGVDLITGTDKYEIKASKFMNGYAFDIKVGGTVNLSNIMSKLYKLKSDYGLAGEGVNKSAMQVIMQKNPAAYQEIEQEYADLTYNNYFKNHNFIFMNNDKSKADYGSVASIKKITKSDIKMERITSNTLKPMIKI